jgi:hypothetical protein
LSRFGGQWTRSPLRHSFSERDKAQGSNVVKRFAATLGNGVSGARREEIAGNPTELVRGQFEAGAGNR